MKPRSEGYLDPIIQDAIIPSVQAATRFLPVSSSPGVLGSLQLLLRPGSSDRAREAHTDRSRCFQVHGLDACSGLIDRGRRKWSTRMGFRFRFCRLGEQRSGQRANAISSGLDLEIAYGHRSHATLGARQTRSRCSGPEILPVVPPEIGANYDAPSQGPPRWLL